MDQLVNSAAKWHYMFGSQLSVSVTYRLIIGRGWGQGPTHSQNLQSWFNHIPGIKVVSPTFADDAKNLLISSIFDPNPVIFLEHRWLHDLHTPELDFDRNKQIGKARLCKTGKDFTIISYSYLTYEALEATKILDENYNIKCDLIDLRTIKPLDWQTVHKSLKKTGRMIVLDTGHKTGSVASDIISNIVTNQSIKLKLRPVKLAMPDFPEPTTFALTKNFYISSRDIVNSVLKNLNIRKKKNIRFSTRKYHDKPGDWFKGPF